MGSFLLFGRDGSSGKRVSGCLLLWKPVVELLISQRARLAMDGDARADPFGHEPVSLLFQPARDPGADADHIHIGCFESRDSVAEHSAARVGISLDRAAFHPDDRSEEHTSELQ